MADVATLVLKVNSKEVKVGRVELDKFGTTASNTAKKVDKTTASVDKFTGRNKVMAREFSSSAKVIGRDLSRYITIPFVAASTAALKFSSELTTGLGQVETLIAGTGSRIYELQDLVTGLSSETGLAFDDLNRGLYETVSAFQDGADTAGRFEAAVKASVAGNATVLDSVKLISAVTKAYGDTSEEAADKVADLAFATIKYGQTTLSELAPALQQVSANSARLKVSQEELFSVFATLTGVTGDAAIVSTGLNRALISLANPTKSLTALYAQYTDEQGETVKTGEDFLRVTGGVGNAFKIIKEAADSTGKPLEDFITRETGVRIALALAGNQADVFAQKSSAVADSVGAMEEAYFAATTGIDEFQRILKQTRQTLATVGAELGQVILPTIVTVAKQVADAATAFSELDDETKKSKVQLLAVLAAVGPLTIAFGSLLRVLKLFGDLGALFSAGQLAFLTNPAVLIGVAAAAGIAAIAFGNWYRETKLQAEALVALKNASISAKDASTEFYEFYGTLEDVNAASLVSIENNEKLKQQYPELAKAVGDVRLTYGQWYTEMLKLEALKFSQTLEPQRKMFADVKEMIEETTTFEMEAYGNLLDMVGRDEIEALGGIENVVKLYRENAEAFRDTDIFQFSFGEFQEYLTALDDASQAEQERVDFLDKLQKEVERSSAGLFTIARDIEFGKDLTTDIRVIPLAELKDQVAEGNEILGNLGASEEPNESKRLKTWADYFAEITGIAGEAFAQIEYVDGKAVGFIRGQGKLAADAYQQGFINEWATTSEIAKAIGQSFDVSDQRDLIEGNIEKTVSDLQELLTLQVRELNKEGLDFSVADLLTGDAVSVEEMIQVFGLDDKSVSGMIDLARQQIEKFTQATEVMAHRMINEIDAPPVKLFGEGIFNVDNIEFERAQNNVESIREMIEEVQAIGGDTSRLELFEEGELEKMRKASITLDNILSDLEAAPSLGMKFGTAMFDAFKKTEKGAEDFNIQIASLSGLLADSLDASVSGLSTLANDLGYAAGAMEDLDNAFGDYALTLAQTISQLAIAAGLQLIIAQQYALGLGLIAAGLAGQFTTGYVQGVVAEETENNAKGGVYSGGVRMFAKGGVLSDFANSIVDKPTMFNNGSAMMGEAGPEAIIPLTRASNGELGVNASGVGGGSAKVNVVVNNYGEDDAIVSETQNADGSVDIEVTIGKMMSSAVSKGKLDSAMKGRYGVAVKGLN